MTPPRSRPDPFDSVRDAFSGLGTSEKAAFVLEATFATIGQALAETGRRAAAVVDDLDIDSWFRSPRADAGAPAAPASADPPPPMAATPADLKTTATRPKPPAEKPDKTAGTPKRRPPADDES